MSPNPHETASNRRQFLRLVGAASAGAVAFSGGAAATIADGLETATDDLQEALVVFDDAADVGRLAELDLAEGFYGYETLPIGYGLLSGDQLLEVAGWDEVRRVSPNVELDWEHDDARPDTRARDVQEGEGLETPYTGENVHAAVIDTGIDGAHPDLEENLEANWQWVGNPLDEGGDEDVWVDLGLVNSDDVGHGTHCSGSIGADGSESDGEYRGMAPDVTLTSYSTNASLTLLKATSAYDHLLTLQEAGEHEIHLASNSYGAGPGEFDPWDPLNVATWHAYEADVLVSFSAGNDGPENDTLGQRKQAPYVMNVAAAHADQSITDFSSRGDTEGNHDRETAFGNVVDLYSGVPEAEIDGPLGLHRPGVAAKGADVMSTLNPAQPLWALGEDEELWYGLLSGTSMACPVAVGCASLVIDAFLEHHGEVPDPIDVISTLEATADAEATDGLEEPSGTADYTPTNAGAGYVDALAATRRGEDGDLASFEEVILAGE
ncbi:peptidase S8/S53 subtilisin kexin sedolisin [Natronococcus pandeyae]|uniref:Peptidase S8/S53 subtilisin kexin sedolisin n=1 Tax=Natronococcus pandeyae TaxID=2055836 RepID=A0A8J8Q235_9EURY|nr:S8 family serine peptidase [Natronococcus pandeyae]TYL38996.1 peptidase S8/S53 subtilisin kexin sedolisin [Natronococcus pandeyae]